MTSTIMDPAPKSVPNRFNWLHLSDLHFGQRGQSDYLPNIRKAFFDDLRKIHPICGPWHAVFFTGDLVFSGERGQFDDLQREFLDPLWRLLKELGSDGIKLFAVPGNHDLKRPKNTAAVSMLTDSFSSLAQSFWVNPKGEYHRAAAQTLKAYSDWWKSQSKRSRVDCVGGFLPGDFAHTLEKDGRRIGILGLNSTCLQLQAGDFKGKLAVHPAQVRHLVKDIVNWVADHDVCIFLTHQGPEWFSAAAQDDYTEINPAGRFAVHLFGHEHASVFSGQSWGGGDTRWVWQGPSLFSQEPIAFPHAEERRHGYVAGRIEFANEAAVIRFWPREAINPPIEGWRFIPDHDSAKLENDDGTPRKPVSIQRAVRPAPVPARPDVAAIDDETVNKLYPTVIDEMTSLIGKNPKLLQHLADIFDLETTSKKHDQLATSLTVIIVNDFAEALDKLVERRPVLPDLIPELTSFMCLILPLSVSLDRISTTDLSSKARLLPSTSTNLAAELDRAATVGRPFEGELDQFRPGVPGKKEFDVNVLAGPNAEEKLADLKDDLRDRLPIKLRAHLLKDVLKWSGEVADNVLAGYLHDTWKSAPDPYFAILGQAQQRLHDWLRNDEVFQHLLVYQRSDQCDTVLTINEGALIHKVELFVEGLRKVHQRPRSVSR